MDQSQESVQQVVDFLNRVLEKDPDAIRGLFSHRVSCNLSLVDDSHFFVQENLAVPGYNIGALGMLNGSLTVLGLPRVAGIWSDEIPSKLIGFKIYEPGKEQA